MFYSKNLPGWERALRVVVGVLMVAGALYRFGATPTGWTLVAIAAGAMLTGLFGFCPACAMVGRKLKG